MNKTYLHNDMDYKKIIIDYIVALVPLIIYGFYKNGIVLYQNDAINLFELFIPLIYPCLGGLIGYLINYSLTKRKELNFYLLYGILFGMIVSINLNIFAFIIIGVLVLVFFKMTNLKINFNLVCLMKILTILALFVFQNYHYQNVLEMHNSYSYNYFNLLFGKGVSGISISNTFLAIVAYFYLAFNPYYKKDIPLVILVVFSICSIIHGAIIHNYSPFINNITTGTIVFASVFIATNSINCPYTKYGKLIYAILIGLITFALTIIFNRHEAIFIAIFLVSIFTNQIDNFILHKIRQNI